jgi:hypothetical protein
MAAGIIFCILGLGGFCSLLFRFTIYALPTFAGVAAGLWAFNTGAGSIGAMTVGAVAAGATLAVCQLGFGLARSAVVRTLVAFIFATPAAYAGYHVVFDLAGYGVPSEAWRQVFAIAGAIAIGFTAMARLAAPAGMLGETDRSGNQRISERQLGTSGS